jgi:hypothetical protein
MSRVLSIFSLENRVLRAASSEVHWYSNCIYDMCTSKASQDLAPPLAHHLPLKIPHFGLVRQREKLPSSHMSSFTYTSTSRRSSTPAFTGRTKLIHKIVKSSSAAADPYSSLRIGTIIRIKPPDSNATGVIVRSRCLQI